MKLFPQWHSPEAVARELIAGLDNGTVVLPQHSTPPDEEEAFRTCAKFAVAVGTLGLRQSRRLSIPDPTAAFLSRVTAEQLRFSAALLGCGVEQFTRDLESLRAEYESVEKLLGIFTVFQLALNVFTVVAVTALVLTLAFVLQTSPITSGFAALGSCAAGVFVGRKLGQRSVRWLESYLSKLEPSRQKFDHLTTAPNRNFADVAP